MPERTTKASIYELFMLGLCVYVLVALALTTFFQTRRVGSGHPEQR